MWLYVSAWYLFLLAEQLDNINVKLKPNSLFGYYHMMRLMC